MFFENENISFNLLEVVKISQEKANIYNYGRNFSALSFRLRADTVLKDKNGDFHMKDNYVSFVPSQLDYRRISEYDELIVVHFETINYHAKTIEFFVPQEPEILRELFERIFDCWSKKELGYKYKCSAIFNEILSVCYSQNFKPSPVSSKIQKSVDYLLMHYRDPNLSISEIADRSFVSEVYFRKLFKDEYGTSPQKYIIRLRIQYAAELILTGYYSLKEIALMSGYTDYKYFSTEFKRQTGISPSSYSYNG